MPNDSGRISLRNGAIHVEGIPEPYTLDASKVLLVGELTTDRGPFIDDWWLLFFTEPGTHASASMYAEGYQEFLDALGDFLGRPLITTLAGSADYASNVLWPESLDGRPVFTFTDIPARTALGKAWEWFLGGPRFNRRDLTPEVEAYLRGASKQ